MSRSAEQLLPKIFGFYTTQIGHRKRHMDRFRLLSLPKRQNTVLEKKVRKDSLDFPSSSEKTYGCWGMAGGMLKQISESIIKSTPL